VLVAYSLLATHPPMDARVERLRRAERQRDAEAVGIPGR